MSDYAAEFHAHLDQCDQCREHPLALCAVGFGLLCAATKDEKEQSNGPQG